MKSMSSAESEICESLVNPARGFNEFDLMQAVYE